MLRRLWGRMTILSSLALWLWVFFALPNFHGAPAMEAQEARRLLFAAFTGLAMISLFSGLLLARRRE